MAKHWGNAGVPTPCPGCGQPALLNWAPAKERTGHVEWWVAVVTDEEELIDQPCDVCLRGVVDLDAEPRPTYLT